jgi:hypothetical protein
MVADYEARMYRLEEAIGGAAARTAPPLAD